MLIEEAREKIKTTQLINRLQDHALSEKDIMTPSQVRSVEILLKKRVPDLQSVTIGGDEENPLTITLAGLGVSVDGKLKRLIGERTDKPTE